MGAKEGIIHKTFITAQAVNIEEGMALVGRGAILRDVVLVDLVLGTTETRGHHKRLFFYERTIRV